MILTAHQPVYLPWLGLFHKIALADTFVFLDTVQYLPKDWNNRNKIKTPQGSLWLTVPVLTKGHREKPIREIAINNTLPWRRKHWRTMVTYYQKAPFFRQYAPFFEECYKREWRFLSELCEFQLKWFLKTLGLSPKWVKASEEDFQGRKSALVLDMCQKLGASAFIFGALGRNYADLPSFEQAGIKVIFQDYRHPTYPQLHGPFVSHLSIVDLLFNCGPKSLEILMSGNLKKEDILAGVSS